MVLPQGVTRRGIPLLVKDMVFVSNPEILRKIASSPDIGRSGEGDLPWILKYWFTSSMFIYPATNHWFLGMVGDGENNYAARRQVVEGLLSKGFSEQHIAKFVELVKSDGDASTVGPECAKMIGDLILPLKDGEKVPDNVAQAACNTSSSFTTVLSPWKTFQARTARYTVEEYVKSLMPDEPNVADYAHNLGAAAHGLGDAVVLMRNIQHDDIRIHFAHNPPLGATFRMPLRTTTLDGIFPEDAPLTQQSFIIMDLKTAAQETLDEFFIFSSGIEHRACPFMNLFWKTATEIQSRLKA